MVPLLGRIDALMAKVEQWLTVLAGVALLLGLLVIVITVFTRYALNRPQGWVIEVGGYLLLLLVYLTVAHGLRSGEYPRMELVARRFGRRTDVTTRVLSLVILLPVLGLAIWHGIELILRSVDQGWTTSTLGLPQWPLLVIPPLGFTLLFVEVGLSAARRLVASLRHEDNLNPTGQ